MTVSLLEKNWKKPSCILSLSYIHAIDMHCFSSPETVLQLDITSMVLIRSLERPKMTTSPLNLTIEPAQNSWGRVERERERGNYVTLSIGNKSQLCSLLLSVSAHLRSSWQPESHNIQLTWPSMTGETSARDL